MDDGSHGYDVSVGYTYGFGPEMAPDWVDLCARIAGYRSNRGKGAPSRYLELGAGQGMGLCLLAASNPLTEFVGVDFLPEHVAHAKTIAAAAGLTNIRFSAADFVDLAAAWPEDFGTFDHVVLHGVHSWVAPDVRAAIVECLRHATRPGSLIYDGYNSQPGWLGAMPFQHITRVLHETTGKPGAAAFEDSIALFDRLRAGGADTFQILPGLKTRLDLARDRTANYLVHEYLHSGWQPLWHSEVATALAAADLHFIGPANIAETMLPDVLPPPLRDAIVELPDGRLRQDVQDFTINQSFRRDLFCRGPRGELERDVAVLTRLRVHVIRTPDGDVEIKAAFGEIRLQRPAFAAIVAALDAGAKSIDALAALPEMRQQGAATTLQVVLLLLHARIVAIEAAEPAPAETAHRLNVVVAREAAKGMPYDHVAAATLGSAVPVTDVDLLLLDSWFTSAGKIDAATLAKGLGERLAKLDRTPQRAGLSLATAFLDRSLPRWRKLGAIA